MKLSEAEHNEIQRLLSFFDEPHAGVNDEVFRRIVSAIRIIADTLHED